MLHTQVQLPPDEELPAAVRPIATEFRELRRRLADAHREVARLNTAAVNDTARYADEAAVAEAVRAGADGVAISGQHTASLMKEKAAAHARVAAIENALQAVADELVPAVREHLAEGHARADEAADAAAVEFLTAIRELNVGLRRYVQAMGVQMFWTSAANPRTSFNYAEGGSVSNGRGQWFDTEDARRTIDGLRRWVTWHEALRCQQSDPEVADAAVADVPVTV